MHSKLSALAATAVIGMVEVSVAWAPDNSEFLPDAISALSVVK